MKKEGRGEKFGEGVMLILGWIGTRLTGAAGSGGRELEGQLGGRKLSAMNQISKGGSEKKKKAEGKHT